MPEFFVSELNLRCFRSHLAGRVAAEGRPVVLYGENGSGKTSVLEAVSLFSPGRGLRGAAPEEISRSPELAGWKVEGELSAAGRAVPLETLHAGGAGRQVRIAGKPASQLELGRIIRILWLTPSMDRLWTEGADGRRRFLDRTAMSFFPNHPADVVGYEKSMRERNRLFRERIESDDWLNALEARMAEHGARINASRSSTLDRLSRESAAADTPFPAARLELRGSGESVGNSESAEELAAALRSGRARDRAAGRALSGPHRADVHSVYEDRGVEARRCSTGEQKALLVSLVLANARAISRELGGAPVLLLDEVAAHLDKSRRRDLFEEIRSIDAQVWMTGTDAGLFDGFAPDAVRAEVVRKAGCSEIRLRQ